MHVIVGWVSANHFPWRISTLLSTPVACFGHCHRTIYTRDRNKLMYVLESSWWGPCGTTRWHKVFLDWNANLARVLPPSVKMWTIARFVLYDTIANLQDMWLIWLIHLWKAGLLACNREIFMSKSPPAIYNWETNFVQFARCKTRYDEKIRVMHFDLLMLKFVDFAIKTLRFWNYIIKFYQHASIAFGPTPPRVKPWNENEMENGHYRKLDHAVARKVISAPLHSLFFFCAAIQCVCVWVFVCLCLILRVCLCLIWCSCVCCCVLCECMFSCLCLYVCLCVCVYACLLLCLCLCSCVYAFVCLCSCFCVFLGVCVCVCFHAFACLYLCVCCCCVCGSAFVCVRVCVYMFVFVCFCLGVFVFLCFCVFALVKGPVQCAEQPWHAEQNGNTQLNHM